MAGSQLVVPVRLTTAQSATETDFYRHLHAAAAAAGCANGSPVPRNLDGLDELLAAMSASVTVRVTAPGLSRLPRNRAIMVLAVCAANGVTVDARALPGG
ncbi:hypothetical protein JZY06_06430 [Corynebacterium sp. CCM 8862]|uniref:Uncharacterized protein n=1 Tax=Corynebacterium mendelii TaxID=2765362 RepID=A0A939E223_9CORY|nr:hypothetical protein [Corynebacterium mendelii]MBN9644251.1 hypothetical protein [Corynebacterium mendelii]